MEHLSENYGYLTFSPSAAVLLSPSYSLKTGNKSILSRRYLFFHFVLSTCLITFASQPAPALKPDIACGLQCNNHKWHAFPIRQHRIDVLKFSIICLKNWQVIVYYNSIIHKSWNCLWRLLKPKLANNGNIALSISSFTNNKIHENQICRK